MKKLFIVLCIAGIISINPNSVFAEINFENEQSHISTVSEELSLIIPINYTEKLNYRINDLAELTAYVMEDCVITLKGTYKGEDIDLTITIKGQSCAEFFKELLKD